MKKKFYLLLVCSMVLAACGNVTEEEKSGFRNSMGCEDIECTNAEHYHGCDESCTNAEHYHGCDESCTNAEHYHDCDINCNETEHHQESNHHK